jgi:hypothetical protein
MAEKIEFPDEMASLLVFWLFGWWVGCLLACFLVCLVGFLVALLVGPSIRRLLFDL